jgi:hypothetical protein
MPMHKFLVPDPGSQDCARGAALPSPEDLYPSGVRQLISISPGHQAARVF